MKDMEKTSSSEVKTRVGFRDFDTKDNIVEKFTRNLKHGDTNVIFVVTTTRDCRQRKTTTYCANFSMDTMFSRAKNPL